jgi:hypothetical protein
MTIDTQATIVMAIDLDLYRLAVSISIPVTRTNLEDPPIPGKNAVVTGGDNPTAERRLTGSAAAAPTPSVKVMTTTAHLHAPAGIRSRLLADTRYVVTGFPVALAAVVLCATGFAVGAGLAVLWIGVPVMVAALLWSRRIAGAERARITAVLREPVPAPRYRTARTSSPIGAAIAMLSDPQSWRDLVHATVRFIPSTIAFSVVVAWWAGLLGGLTWSLWGWSLPDGPDNKELPELLGFGDAYLTTVAFYLVVAVLLALTLPAVARGAALFEARIARALLTPAAPSR